MREYKTINTKRLVESKVVCNKCGLTYDNTNSQHGYEEWQWATIHPFKVEFGYGSNHDLENWQFDLCETCIEEIVSGFNFKPKVEVYDPFH